MKESTSATRSSDRSSSHSSDLGIAREGGEPKLFVLPKEAWMDSKRELVRTFGPGGRVLLYHMGQNLGKSLAEDYPSATGADRPRDYLPLIRTLQPLSAALGWGTLKITPLNKKRFEVELGNCAFCEGVGDGRGVCYELAGMISGFAEAVNDRSFRVTETRCEANGDEACTFEASPHVSGFDQSPFR